MAAEGLPKFPPDAMSSIAKEFVMSAVLHVNQQQFNHEVLESTVPVVVDFYADWCGPCRAQAPILDQVARDNVGAKVVKVNIDDSPQLAEKFGVQAIPTLLVFKQGQVANVHQGLARKEQIEGWLAG
jgi:thioredoxin 1